ncbi:uncharacterized protein LOC125462440 [Stegostoma tigrinum]|uniref:uncharacterized protein LOC125462440 n=1 Tax=Stegostoma tigrinum TaxID=3053191 RepID=UPI00286FE730|nr:uncharacterized protein LOC125462440 [Stegostoma tigrinum]
MTDGERRQPAQPLGSEDVRVPLTGTSPADVDTDDGGLCSGSSGNIAMENMGPLSDSSFSAQELGAEEIASDPATEHLPYPALAPAVFFCLKQTTRPRSWCLKVIRWVEQPNFCSCVLWSYISVRMPSLIFSSCCSLCPLACQKSKCTDKSDFPRNSCSWKYMPQLYNTRFPRMLVLKSSLTLKCKQSIVGSQQLLYTVNVVAQNRKPTLLMHWKMSDTGGKIGTEIRFEKDHKQEDTVIMNVVICVKCTSFNHSQFYGLDH